MLRHPSTGCLHSSDGSGSIPVFWPDSLSLVDADRVDSARLLAHGQVTDSYLLALAIAHQGKLATFDRRVVVDAVRGGRQALQLI